MTTGPGIDRLPVVDLRGAPIGLVNMWKDGIEELALADHRLEQARILESGWAVTARDMEARMREFRFAFGVYRGRRRGRGIDVEALLAASSPEPWRPSAGDWVDALRLTVRGQYAVGPCPLCGEGHDRFYVRMDEQATVSCRRCYDGDRNWYRDLVQAVFPEGRRA